MLSDHLRRVSKPFLDLISGALSRLGVSPNLLTLVGFAGSVAVAVVLGLGHLRIGGVLVLAASALDSLDGALARYTGRATAFGAFLDSTLDRYSEAALYSALVWHFAASGDELTATVAAAALFGSLAVSYTRARAEGLRIECKVGLFTRVERILALAVGLAIGLPELTLWVVAILSHVTAAQRILHVRRQMAQ